MRCLRIGLAMVKNYHEIIEFHCETFIQFVLHLLASRQAEWQSAAALEVLHKIVGQPDLLRWLCSSFHFRPNCPKLVEMIVRGLTNYNCRALRKGFKFLLLFQKLFLLISILLIGFLKDAFFPIVFVITVTS